MTSITSLLACTRATPVAAYYTKADGTLTTFAANTLRYGTNGLLVEAAATNTWFQSQTFGTTWVPATNATITADAAVAPDGTTTADLFTAGGGGSYRGSLSQAIAVSASVSVTCSVYIKKNNYSYFGIRINTTDIGGTDKVPFYNFDTDTLSTVGIAGATLSRTLLANGWVRLALNFTTTDTSATIQLWMTASDGATNWTPVGTESVYLWGAQRELPATASTLPTSYIPTTTVAVTRAADIVTFSDLSWLNGTGDSIYAEWTAVGAAGTVLVLDTANDTTLAEATGAAKISDAGATFAITTGNAATTATTAKAATRMATNDIALCLNAGTVGTDTSATQPGTLAAARLGVDLAGANALNGYIRRVAAFKGTSLTNGALQTLST